MEGSSELSAAFFPFRRIHIQRKEKFVNIHDFWPAPGELPEPTAQGIAQLLELRRETFHGFLQREARRGLLNEQSLSLSSPRGQDAFRLLLFRCLEELMEAQHSVSISHVKEEVIDAINYFLSLALLDREFHLQALAAELAACVSQCAFCHSSDVQPPAETAAQLIQNASAVLETLRNRAWQSHAQSAHFDGYELLSTYMCSGLLLLLQYFTGWEEFVSYYIAKDRVLQFRLRSGY